MPRVLGIDPGTVSIDVCGLDDGKMFLDRSLSTAEVARDPEALLQLLDKAAPLALIAGPSGYGLPLVPIGEVGEREIRLAFLARPGEPGGVGGFRTLVRRMREAGLPTVFTPGVVHLSTVPSHRKANRIDLGTADKVCAAALAIAEQAERLGVPFAETAFVLVELGGAFTAVLSVRGGRIVSGAGGSSGPPGYRAGGAMDGEVAYLLGPIGKQVVFAGGAAWIAGRPEEPPEALAARSDDAARTARTALTEGVVRAVAGELAIAPGAREILLSGRLSDVPAFAEPIAERLHSFAPVRRVEGFATVAKHAAQGAALIADGLAGGRYKPLVETMRLRDAAGTVLDHLHLPGVAEATRWIDAAPV